MNGENGALEGSENGTKEVLEEETSLEEQDDDARDEVKNQNGDLNSHEDDQAEEDGISDTNGGETSKSGEEEEQDGIAPSYFDRSRLYTIVIRNYREDRQ